MRLSSCFTSLGLLSACTLAPPTGEEFAGLVVAATPEATAAGVAILEAGGNAIDAAVAVSLALGVSEPAGSGIGGQAFILLFSPETGAKVIHGSSRSPRVLPAGMELKDLVGHKATTVPSLLKVLDVAKRRFGSDRVSWQETCAPAIACAETGFVRGHFRTGSMDRYGSPVARALAAGTDRRVRRPALAKTLRRIADHGAADFYTGEIAQAIVADMVAHGGLVTAADLQGLPEPSIVEPLTGTYRGRTVYTLPPPAGGWVVLRALNVLELADPAQLIPGQPDQMQWMANALYIAHSDRYDAPVRQPSDVQAKIDKAAARRALQVREGGETTHFCVVDGDGMVVAVTQSLNAYYGAKVFAGDLGFLYNDYMREFVVGQGDHPFALRPDSEPYSSMSATIVVEDGEPILTVGSPGSRRIISAVVQVLSHTLDGGMKLPAAVAAPRMHVVPEEDQLMLERRPAGSSLVRKFESRGLDVAIPLSGLGRDRRNPYFGGVHALARSGDGWVGAPDPRRDGAAGYARRSDPR